MVEPENMNIFATQFWEKCDESLRVASNDLNFKLFGYLRYNMKQVCLQK